MIYIRFYTDENVGLYVLFLVLLTRFNVMLHLYLLLLLLWFSLLFLLHGYTGIYSFFFARCVFFLALRFPPLSKLKM